MAIWRHIIFWYVLLWQIDSLNKVWVSDFGLHTIKKYASVTLDYCNKSAWSSPQVLDSRHTTANAVCTIKDDVYSFGVVLWELLYCKEPFEGIPRQRLYQLVVEEQMRPLIVDEVGQRLATLIKSCWNNERHKRPTFKQLAKQLARLRNFN